MLEAMLDADQRVPIPDTGSLLTDLVAYITALAATLNKPGGEGTLRAVAATGDREVALADASRRYWSTRRDFAAKIVERAISRGEVPPGTDSGLVIDALTAPIYNRVLVSIEPLDAAFLHSMAELVAVAARSGLPTPDQRHRDGPTITGRSVQARPRRPTRKPEQTAIGD